MLLAEKLQKKFYSLRFLSGVIIMYLLVVQINPSINPILASQISNLLLIIVALLYLGAQTISIFGKKYLGKQVTDHISADFNLILLLYSLAMILVPSTFSRINYPFLFLIFVFTFVSLPAPYLPRNRLVGFRIFVPNTPKTPDSWFKINLLSTRLMVFSGLILFFTTLIDRALFHVVMVISLVSIIVIVLAYSSWLGRKTHY